MKKLVVAILMAMMFAIAAHAVENATEYTDSLFQNRIQKAATPEAKAKIYNDFSRRAKDMDVIRVVEDAWRMDDSSGVIAFYEKAVKQNPKSAKNMYLLGRLQNTDSAKIAYGRKTIALDSKFPYGYRLVLTNYQPVLNAPASQKESILALRAEMMKDTALFAAWSVLSPHDELAQMLCYQFLVYSKRYDDAELLIDRCKPLKMSWANDRELANLYARKGLFVNALNTIKDYVEGSPNAAKMSKEEIAENIDGLYIDALTSANANDQIIKYLSDNPSFATNPDYMLQAAYASVRMMNLDKAFGFFDQIIAAGGVSMGSLDAEEMVALKADSRWTVTESKLKDAWVKSADKRRAKVVAGKINEPAPDWEFPTPEGGTVKLSSLKGTVVVLDFWATWCGPCKMSMPIISAYTEKKPAGVRIFSVDVWDGDHAKAAPFMNYHKYAMELLYGTDTKAKEYNVTGIPTLFVIDKKGYIRYKEVGYSPELTEKLPWWIDDVLSIKE